MPDLRPQLDRINCRSLATDRNLALIVSIALMTILGIVSINPVLPTIAEVFHVSPGRIGLVISVYVLPILIGAPILGLLADRVGRKTIIIPSLLLFAITGILCATASDFQALLMWRFFQGVGAAGLELLALTLIGDLYTGEAITSAMAFLGGLIAVSSIVLPLLGGTLTAFSWRLVFLLSIVAIPISVLVLAKLKLPAQTKSFDFSLHTYAVDLWSSIRSVQMLGLLFAVICVFILQFGPCYIYIPIVAASLKASSEIIGALLASTQIFLALFASQIVPLSRRLPESTLIKLAFLMFAIAFLLVPFMSNVWLLFVPCLLLGAAEALSLSPTRALIARISPHQTRAGFMSTTVLAQSLGQAFGPILFGIVFDVGGMQSGFFICAGFAVLIVGILALIFPTDHL